MYSLFEKKYPIIETFFSLFKGNNLFSSFNKTIESKQDLKYISVFSSNILFYFLFLVSSKIVKILSIIKSICDTEILFLSLLFKLSIPVFLSK